MSVTIWDLPPDLMGKWMIALTEPHSDSFAGTTFVGGVSQSPTQHWGLRALVGSGVGIAGLLRVEGEPCELGDCSRLKPKAPEASPAAAADAPPGDPPVAPETDAPAALAGTPAPSGDAPVSPKSMADLDAMSDDEVRAIAAELGKVDGRWGPAKIREYVALELNLGT